MNQIKPNQSVVNFAFVDAVGKAICEVMPNASENEMVDQLINVASILSSRFIQQLPGKVKAKMHADIVRALDQNIKIHSRNTSNPQESVIYTGYSDLSIVPDSVLFSELAQYIRIEEKKADIEPVYSQFFMGLAMLQKISDCDNSARFKKALNGGSYLQALRLFAESSPVGMVRAFAAEVIARYGDGNVSLGGRSQ